MVKPKFRLNQLIIIAACSNSTIIGEKAKIIYVYESEFEVRYKVRLLNQFKGPKSGLWLTENQIRGLDASRKNKRSVLLFKPSKWSL